MLRNARAAGREREWGVPTGDAMCDTHWGRAAPLRPSIPRWRPSQRCNKCKFQLAHSWHSNISNRQANPKSWEGAPPVPPPPPVGRSDVTHVRSGGGELSAPRRVRRTWPKVEEAKTISRLEGCDHSWVRSFFGRSRSKIKIFLLILILSLVRSFQNYWSRLILRSRSRSLFNNY